MVAPTPCSEEIDQVPRGSKPGPLLRTARLFAFVAVAGLFVLLVWRVVHAGRGSRLVAEVRSGKNPAAPQFTLPVLWARTETWPNAARQALVDGQVTLRELRGYPVVVNFWASWCIPCKDEAPLLAASARAHAGSVVFLGIDVQDFRSDARRFLRRFDTPYVSVRAGGGGTSGVYEDYGLTGVPETYWLDARGHVIAQYPGQISRDQLEDGIGAAVAAR